MATQRIQTMLRLINNVPASSLSRHRVPVCNSNILSCSTSTSSSSSASGSGSSPRLSTASVPVLNVRPNTSLCDEQLDIEVHGLAPGQLVSIEAQVYTECGRYKFQSSALYEASKNGQVSVRQDASLGGSYKGVEPLGLIWSLEPAPEVKHKYPRLLKTDVTIPFKFKFQLKIQDGEQQDEQPSANIAETIVERHFLADYVEQIPLNMGRANGVLFLPKERGSSDPLPVVIDIRGLLVPHVIDRAALLASHGFAVFAYDYFRPLVASTTTEIMYQDSMAFHDMVDFISDHPRLDVNRIGITCSCFGGAITLNAASRLKLPIKCIAAAGFIDTLCVNIGWKMPDGSLIEPFGPIDQYMLRWTDDNGKLWVRFTEDVADESGNSDPIPPVENIDCPMLFFGHAEDHHIPSSQRVVQIKDYLEAAGKGHLLDFHWLPGTGHFLEVPFQPKCPVSSLIVPTRDGQNLKPHYTTWGGEDAKQVAVDQEFAWRKIINFFRTHLNVTEMYRQDWISDYSRSTGGD